MLVKGATGCLLCWQKIKVRIFDYSTAQDTKGITYKQNSVHSWRCWAGEPEKPAYSPPLGTFWLWQWSMMEAQYAGLSDWATAWGTMNSATEKRIKTMDHSQVKLFRGRLKIHYFLAIALAHAVVIIPDEWQRIGDYLFQPLTNTMWMFILFTKG